MIQVELSRLVARAKETEDKELGIIWFTKRIVRKVGGG